MAYGRYRKRYKRRSSKPASMVAQITKPIRAPFKMIGVQSPIAQTLLAVPVLLMIVSRVNEDWYDYLIELPETINDFVDERIGV
tara:strand:+ start:495 stop:746 length:252 start_codon:yes stop_codon:yes gene_type:complete